MHRRVRVSYGRTIQTAPYESLRLDVAIEKDLDDTDNMLVEVEKSREGLVAYVKSAVKKIIAEE